MNLRERALQADDLHKEPISIPEWKFEDGEAFVTTMTAEQKADLEESVTKIVKKKGKSDIEIETKKLRVLTVISTLVDAEGKNVFAMSDFADLSRKSALIIERIFDLSNKLNSLTAESEEEIEKN